MLKLFGAGLTMFSCFAAGCLICAEMKKRIHILEELRRMTVMLSAEIGYANTMLDEAFGSIAKRVSQPLSDFLVHVQEKMQKGEEANLGVIFEKRPCKPSDAWRSARLSGCGDAEKNTGLLPGTGQ